jgi:hypothetical protein
LLERTHALNRAWKKSLPQLSCWARRMAREWMRRMIVQDPTRAAGNAEALGELLPPLTANEASVEAARCLMCFDAPCTLACPTHIDIPKFIKKISTGNLRGSARAILESNLLGATCARVCPPDPCTPTPYWDQSTKPIVPYWVPLSISIPFLRRLA